jgi:hypothetical protein
MSPVVFSVTLAVDGQSKPESFYNVNKMALIVGAQKLSAGLFIVILPYVTEDHTHQ